VINSNVLLKIVTELFTFSSYCLLYIASFLKLYILKHVWIAYFIGNISAKKCQNPFMCVKVIASHRRDVFLRHGV